jgi:XTP/dITP diphosphohydrolase
MQLLIATRNPAKLAEIRELFLVPGVDVVGALDVPGLPEVEEDEPTLEGNAAKKAVTLARHTGGWALADDTGLEVEALGGAPGVYSARYAGPVGDDAANVAKLLAAMQGRANRAARFRTVVALADPGGRSAWIEGVCDGTITTERRGAGGFGYDPVFLPRGDTKTFAEMSASRKNAISHRARALAAARTAWGDWLAGHPDRLPAPR